MPFRAADPPQFGNMVRQMNKIMDQLQKGFFSFCPAETWMPTVNLYESEQAYLVCVDLSGVEKEKIDLVVSDGSLKLRGQRATPAAPPGMGGAAATSRMRVHLMEIDHGPFCREVSLPTNVDAAKVHASYRNGMLWVELPKKA